jgi:prevent-host-death family protein
MVSTGYTGPTRTRREARPWAVSGPAIALWPRCGYRAAMKSAQPDGSSFAEVPVRVLKDRLSEYLRAVENGTTVVVTSHGRALADLVPHRGVGSALVPLSIRRPTRTWGSVGLRRKGRGRTRSTELLLEERRR